jgi:hypothetical protein
MIYICQIKPSGHSVVWDAYTPGEAIVCMEGGVHEFETLEDALTHDVKRARWAHSPWDLTTAECNWDGDYFTALKAVTRRWGMGCDEIVHLDGEEWFPDTRRYARLQRFQADDINDLDCAEIGQIEEFDAIYLPEANRAAIVSNGDAVWFDAHSFQHASLRAQGVTKS